jgi:hypothetical protein
MISGINCKYAKNENGYLSCQCPQRNVILRVLFACYDWAFNVEKCKYRKENTIDYSRIKVKNGEVLPKRKYNKKLK